jgi:hypothetical protein
MPHWLTAAVLYLGLIPFVFADDIQKHDPKKLWLTDYATALEQSKQSNKLLFIVFR